MQDNWIIFVPNIEDVDHRAKFLKSCLVGRFMGFGGAITDIERWASKAWGVSVGVKIHQLADDLLLFCLPSEQETQRILNTGSRHKGKALLQVDLWGYKFGCTGTSKVAFTRWIQILGLPVHLWSWNLFKSIGDFCGGFLDAVIDWEGRWDNIRVFVKNKAAIPDFVHIQAHGVCYRVQLLEERAPIIVPEHVDGSRRYQGGDGGVAIVTVDDGIRNIQY